MRSAPPTCRARPPQRAIRGVQRLPLVRLCVARSLVALALVLLLAPAARGDAPVPASVPDLIGARGLSIGAYRGMPAGNDGIFTNTASLAARRRYSIEGQWFLDRVGGATALQALQLSTVDSEAGAVTGGFAYTRVLSGPYIGNLFHVPIAFPLSSSLFAGLTPKYLSLGGPAGDSIRAVNFDASLFVQASSLVALGVSGYNLLSSGHHLIQPRGVGAGISVGDDRRFHVAADWRGDFERQGKLTHLFAAGGELLVGDVFPIRAGYMNDETRNASFWSAGVGLVTTSGFALDAGYRQRFEDPQERTFTVGVKLFVATQ